MGSIIYGVQNHSEPMEVILKLITSDFRVINGNLVKVCRMRAILVSVQSLISRRYVLDDDSVYKE